MSSILSGLPTSLRNNDQAMPVYDTDLMRELQQLRLDVADLAAQFASLANLKMSAGEVQFSPSEQFSAGFNATTTQTGANVYVPKPGKRIAITTIIIGSYGSTAARLLLWMGGNNTTVYTAGLNQLMFGASFAPASTAYPGAIVCPCKPVYSIVPDQILKVTTDGNLSVDIAVHGFEVGA